MSNQLTSVPTVPLPGPDTAARPRPSIPLRASAMAWVYVVAWQNRSEPATWARIMPRADFPDPNTLPQVLRILVLIHCDYSGSKNQKINAYVDERRTTRYTLIPSDFVNITARFLAKEADGDMSGGCKRRDQFSSKFGTPQRFDFLQLVR